MVQREAFQRKVQPRIDQWNAEIDKLRGKAKEAGADAQLLLHQRINELQAKRDAIGQKQGEMHQAGEGAWKELKGGVKNAFRELESAFKAAADKVRGQSGGGPDQGA